MLRSIETKTIWNSPTPIQALPPVYWRVEGSLADLTTVRPVAFFTWNAQTFLERWVRRGMVLLMAVLRPFLYAAHRVVATRVVHTVLRGISRDRLDLLGEEYFKYKLQPYLKVDGMELLKSRIEAGDEIVLVSQGLEHVMRPLAQHLGVKWLIANRLEFRDGIATGRLLEPVIRPRGFLPESTAPGRMGGVTPSAWSATWVCRALQALESAVIPAARQIPVAGSAHRLFRRNPAARPAIGSPGIGREARDADRRYRLHRQGVAGQYADGAA